ncbi:unnamed protein product [Sphenostylis stenocarpa]|uniref:Uncharacterized protein n=1 Tax=Sphenostylis stenocarpa TaxID=92480 RepID=A0AA86VGP4_9FABA|nr:unnamed protein product [Sphenostylis stenocarpa]
MSHCLREAMLAKQKLAKVIIIGETSTPVWVEDIGLRFERTESDVYTIEPKSGAITWHPVLAKEPPWDVSKAIGYGLCRYVVIVVVEFFDLYVVVGVIENFRPLCDHCCRSRVF